MASYSRIEKVIVILSIVFSLAAHADVASSPEQTLHNYIDALRNGDAKKVMENYYSTSGQTFSFSDPIHIRSYKIVKKQIINEKQIMKYPFGVKLGDIELVVIEVIFDDHSKSGSKLRSEKYTYFLRSMDNKWKIYNHFCQCDDS